jgi:hypothetical protein
MHSWRTSTVPHGAFSHAFPRLQHRHRNQHNPQHSHHCHERFSTPPPHVQTSPDALGAVTAARSPSIGACVLQHIDAIATALFGQRVAAFAHLARSQAAAWLGLGCQLLLWVVGEHTPPA